MSEATYDIKFKADADTRSLKEVEDRLHAINAEIEKMSKTGNYGPDLSKLINEETALKLRREEMSLFGPKSPAPGAPGTPGAPGVPAVPGAKPGLPGVPGSPTAPVPGAPILPEAAAAGAGGMATLTAGAVVAAAAVAAVATAVVATGAAMMKGAEEAAAMAKELDKLDESGKAERLRELGDIGDVLERNGQVLLEYGKNWDELKRKPGDFIQGLGTTVAPALNEVAEVVNKLDAAKAGEDFGLFSKGILETVTSFTKLKETLGDTQWWFRPVQDSAGSMMDKERAEQETEEAAAAARRQKELFPVERAKTAEVLGKSSKSIMQDQMDPLSRSVDVEIERELQIAKSLDTSLPEGEREAARKRIAQLNKEYAGLDRRARSVNADAQMEIAQGQAELSGDSSRLRELKYIEDYQSLINKGVEDGAARQIAAQRDQLDGRKAVSVSSLASAGHSVGESRAAAEAAAAGRAPLDMQRINEELLEIAKQDKELKNRLADWLKRPEVESIPRYQP